MKGYSEYKKAANKNETSIVKIVRKKVTNVKIVRRTNDLKKNIDFFYTMVKTGF